MRTAGKSEVRSLVKTTGSSQVTAGSGSIDPGLREVIIDGPSAPAHYSSLKAVSFGSLNERSNPVRLNGKAYRGKLEVFVNSHGSLTVVNVVPLEDYLLGVVPSELGLPQLEAQKAQAVAARTYAVANIGGYGEQGFDMVPTIWSQVYKGVSIETEMGTLAVNSTRGIVATYQGKPINALYTSTCGGRTENSENIFDKAEPYLRGVECSLEGHRHFEPFMIKTAAAARQSAKTKQSRTRPADVAACVNGFSLSAESDDRRLVRRRAERRARCRTGSTNSLARFGKPFPNVKSRHSEAGRAAHALLTGLIYAPGYADTLLSDSDVNYQLAFDDAARSQRTVGRYRCIAARRIFLRSIPI